MWWNPVGTEMCFPVLIPILLEFSNSCVKFVPSLSLSFVMGKGGLGCRYRLTCCFCFTLGF